MELRPGYKQSEVGVIPEEWEACQLGRLVTKVGSGITPTGGGKVYKESGRPFMRSQNVGWGQLLLDDVAYIDEETHARFPDTELKALDVLLNITGASIGRSAVADDRLAGGNVNQHVCIIRPNAGDLDASFLSAFLLSEKGQKQIDGFQAGGNRQGLNFGQIRSFQVPLPSLPEQRAIAAALGDVDALLAAQERLIAKQRALKQAAMQQLLTARTRLPGFAGAWETKRLGDVSAIKTGKRNNEDKCEDGAYPFFVRSQTVERINSYSFDGEAVLVPGEGGIGTIIHYVNGKFDVHQRVYKISNFANDVCGKFVYLSMLLNFGDQATRNSVKATVDSLRLPTFKSFEFQAPRIDEQRAIAAVLSDMDAQIAALEAQRAKTRLLKQGMMQELLTGRTRLL